MSKRLIITIFLFSTVILISLGSYSQDSAFQFQFRCIYKLSFQPDSTKTTSRKTEDMLLLIGDNMSVFKSRNYYIYDSAATKISNFSDLNEIYRTHPYSFKYTISKGPENELKFADFIDIDEYEYKESKDNFNWELINEVDTIRGYYCQKATLNYGGRRWIAWFSKDIAISEGPYKFNGLPGLIVKISDIQNYYIFQLEAIEKSAGQLIFKKRPRTIIAKDKFYSSLDYFNKNKFEVMQLRGLKVTRGADLMRERFANQLKENNNPIEIYTPVSK